MKYILYAKCRDNWYVVNDLIKAAEMHYNFDKPVFLGKYFTLEYAPCVKDMVYELEHNNVDCEMHNRAYCIKEEKIMINYNLDPGTMIVYYLPESLKTYIGYVRKPIYLVSGARVAESVSIMREQILGYMSGDTWIDADTLVPAHIFDILENFNRRYHLSKDEIKENINSIYGRVANDHSHRDSVDSLRYAISPSEQLKKKLKRIEVNGEYMTAVWYDHPATVIKLSENDMYDTEKAYMWLLLKGLCDNNKSECDRVLKLMEDITFEKK